MKVYSDEEYTKVLKTIEFITTNDSFIDQFTRLACYKILSTVLIKGGEII